MGGTKCLRLGTCELEDMGGVLQNDSSISRAVCAAALGCLSCASGGFCLSVRVVGSWGGVHSLLESAGGSCRDIKRAESAESAFEPPKWLFPTMFTPTLTQPKPSGDAQGCHRHHRRQHACSGRP